MSQHEMTILLRNACNVIGGDAIKALLPEPFVICISAHSTGCQIDIDLHVEGIEHVKAWRGSVWYSSCYEFNDRNKELGFQSETKGFCETPLCTFFGAVESAYADKKANQVATAEGRKIEAETSRKNAISLYRNLVKG